jgi:H+/Cl- antiporter ClcA
MADDGSIESKSGLTKVVPMPSSERATGKKEEEEEEEQEVEQGEGGIGEASRASESGAEEMKYNVDDGQAIISQAISNVKLRSTDGKYDARNGTFGGHNQTGVTPLLKAKFLHTQAFGSRMVGGHKPGNMATYNAFESVSYIVPDTAEQEQLFMLSDNRARNMQRVLMWVRYGIVGVLVSLLIAGALRVCSIIEKARVKETAKKLDDNDLIGAWLFWVGTSVGMNMVAVFLVLLQPAAASSGIPGLISYLNGVKPVGGVSPITRKPTSFVSLKTMLAKSMGMICSIPSGLCIGPEGPIIHISALVAYHATTLVHYLEHKVLGKKFDNESENERRDFLATGAACGITTAFRAPLAGTLFVVEEAGSFFTTQHLEYTFFSCLVAYWVQWVLGLSMDGEVATGAKFGQSTGYFCNVDNPLNMVAYVLMAVLGGVLGALFNQVVEKLNHCRAHRVNKRGWARVLEVFLLTVLTGSAVIFLPLLSTCRLATRDIMLKDSAGCLPIEDFAQLSYGEVQFDYLYNILDAANQTATAENASDVTLQGRRSRLLAGSSGSSGGGSGGSSNENATGAKLLANLHGVLDRHRVVPEHRDVTHWDTIYLDNAAPYIHVHYEHTYTCGKGSHAFNDMAMLWLNGGVKGVKVLMQRGFPHMISTTTLWIFLGAYFLLASITAGTHVPAGLVVPLLLIGGSFGRLFGVYWMNFKTGLCSTYVTMDSTDANNVMNYGLHPDTWPNYNMYYWSTVYRWIVRDCKLPDPGTFAVIGMASFMGGSGRITVMLAIVMLELTGDAGMIAPVGLVCVLAMLVGNMFNHGLYHGLIPVMNIPFLNSLPSHVMYVTRVVSIMSKDLHYLPQMVLPAELRVLKYRMSLDRKSATFLSHNGFPVVRGPQDMNLVGLLSKDQLLRLLSDLDSPNKVHSLMWKNGKVDLTMYCERSPLSVLKTTTVSRAYEIFRKLGLRHLVVCGYNGRVEGILTRKDLMVYRIVLQKQRDVKLIIKMQDTMRLHLKSRGFYDHSSANPNRRKSHARRMDRHMKRVKIQSSKGESEQFLNRDASVHL